MNSVLVRDGNDLLIDSEVKAQLIQFEKQAKVIKEKEDEIKKAILNAMKDNNVKQFKSDDLTITYVEEQDREYFDQKAFRTDNPDLYDGYVSFRKTAPSIRIKLG